MEAVSQTGAGTGSSSTDSHGIGSRCLTRAGIRLPPCPASTGLISGRPDLSDRTPSCGERQAGASGLYHWHGRRPAGSMPPVEMHILGLHLAARAFSVAPVPEAEAATRVCPDTMVASEPREPTSCRVTRAGFCLSRRWVPWAASQRIGAARPRRAAIRAAGAEPVVRADPAHPPVAYDRAASRRRHRVENLWGASRSGEPSPPATTRRRSASWEASPSPQHSTPGLMHPSASAPPR